MGRLSLLLLALSLTPVLAADTQKPCSASPSTASTDEKNWTWKDSAGQTRTRAELDGILNCHQQWLVKYRVEDVAQPLSTEASNDPDRADLSGAVLTKADLQGADLSFADLDGADLTGADLTQARLNGTNLAGADLTSAKLIQADLSGAELENTDLSTADLTLAKFWFADFAPAGTLLVSTLSPGEGLETVHWSGPGTIDEQTYRELIESGRYANCPLKVPLTFRWRVWLVGKGEPKLTPPAAIDCSTLHIRMLNGGSPPETPDLAIDRGQFQLMDIRTALKSSGHSAVELEVNLAYQRQTQSWWRMIVYDWTCGYGTDPVRPLIFALILAVLAIPVYGFGFRQRWFGSRIRQIEMDGDKQKETFPGDPNTRPKWREPFDPDSLQQWSRLQRLLGWLGIKRPAERLYSSIGPHWPRLCWEIGFLKSVVIFSLISVVNLSFASFDVGHWARLLFFSEYDLKARGWLRMVSGIQSLIGLGLLALSLLSFFGHRFE